MAKTFSVPLFRRGKTSRFVAPPRNYTDYVGLDIHIAMILCIASTFSGQIANGNAGPTSALDSMGPKPTFRCHFFNIGPSYTNSKREQVLLRPPKVK